jgi:galactose-1-phosphate uridylyltransferase
MLQEIHVKLHSDDASSPDIFVTWNILPVMSPNQPPRWQNFPATLRDEAVKSQISLVIFRNSHENTQNGLGTRLARPMLNIFWQQLNGREP